MEKIASFTVPQNHILVFLLWQKKKTVKNLVPGAFSDILEKFHSVSSHFHFAFTSRKGLKTIISLYTSRKRVNANTFHFSDKSESTLFHFHFSKSLHPLALGAFTKSEPEKAVRGKNKNDN